MMIFISLGGRGAQGHFVKKRQRKGSLYELLWDREARKPVKVLGRDIGEVHNGKSVGLSLSDSTFSFLSKGQNIQSILFFIMVNNIETT